MYFSIPLKITKKQIKSDKKKKKMFDVILGKNKIPMPYGYNI